MRRNLLIGILFFVWAFMVNAQPKNDEDLSIRCGTDEAISKMYEAHPEMKKEAENYEKVIRQITEQIKSGKTKAEASYTIPVVFHVFGTEFNNGKTVTDAIIEDALRRTNQDFQGLTADWNLVDPDFAPVKKALNISFKLAQLDPNGNPTTGVRYYPVKSGFGNDNTYDEETEVCMGQL